jgi:hypothetical protein
MVPISASASGAGSSLLSESLAPLKALDMCFRSSSDCSSCCKRDPSSQAIPHKLVVCSIATPLTRCPLLGERLASTKGGPRLGVHRCLGYEHHDRHCEYHGRSAHVHSPLKGNKHLDCSLIWVRRAYACCDVKELLERYLCSRWEEQWAAQFTLAFLRGPRVAPQEVAAQEDDENFRPVIICRSSISAQRFLGGKEKTLKPWHRTGACTRAGDVEQPRSGPSVPEAIKLGCHGKQ